MTHTRVHVNVMFSDPYLACDACHAWVTGWHDNDRCGCAGTFWNVPCGCTRAGVTSRCPSWSPVDGCRCREHLGYVLHVPRED